jgi:hypothetical protein
VLIVSLSSRISPARVDGDLLAQVAAGDRRRHLGDVADLAGQVAGHEVDVVGEVLPRAGHALHVGLTAELALGAHLARDARDLAANDDSVSTIVLIVAASAAPRPRLDGDLLAQVARATAVATCAMSRTWRSGWTP